MEMSCMKNVKLKYYYYIVQSCDNKLLIASSHTAGILSESHASMPLRLEHSVWNFSADLNRLESSCNFRKDVIELLSLN